MIIRKQDLWDGGMKKVNVQNNSVCLSPSLSHIEWAALAVFDFIRKLRNKRDDLYAKSTRRESERQDPPKVHVTVILRKNDRVPSGILHLSQQNG